MSRLVPRGDDLFGFTDKLSLTNNSKNAICRFDKKFETGVVVEEEKRGLTRERVCKNVKA